MDDPHLTRWWKIILQRDVRDLQDSRLALMGLDQYLAYFQLPGPPPLEFKMDMSPDDHFADPGFENLTEKILVHLRQWIYAQRELDTAALWAEKLMRFCEVRYSILERRAYRKWGDKKIARSNLLQLTAFLLDYSLLTKDIRFLNTVLKLADLKWLFNIKTIKKELTQEGEQFLLALFQFRIALLSEYALSRIRRGETL